MSWAETHPSPERRPLALIRDPDTALTRLLRPPRPSRRAGDVRVAIAWAAVCRTDILVSTGDIPVSSPRVLGHEASGVLLDGPSAGARVVLHPFRPCGRCATCRMQPARCAHATQLGVHVDGAFTTELGLPAEQALIVPDGLPLRRAVMTEPLAAAMGVLAVLGEAPGAVLVPGTDRFAELVRRVLRDAGVTTLAKAGPEEVRVAVDTGPLAELVEALEPGGRLILRGRAPVVPLPLARVVQKGLSLVGAPHAPLPEAVLALVHPRIAVDDLFGPCFPLEEAPAALATAARAPGKVLLRMSGAD